MARVSFEFKKGDLVWVSLVVVLLCVGLGVAYNSGADPSVMGHSAEELEGGMRFLPSPVQILDDTGAKNGVSVSGDISTGLNVDVSNLVPEGSKEVLLTITYAFTANDDQHSKQQIFARSSLPAISGIDINSPYLVLNLEAGKISSVGGESDRDYDAGSNTFFVPIIDGQFEILSKREQTSGGPDYSLILVGYGSPSFSTSSGEWPAGSYCIMRAGGTCPIGFAPSTIQASLGTHDHDLSPQEGPAGDSYATGSGYSDFYFEFCCK